MREPTCSRLPGDGSVREPFAQLVSLPKAVLTNVVATSSAQKVRELDRALVTALGVDTAALTGA